VALNSFKGELLENIFSELKKKLLIERKQLFQGCRICSHGKGIFFILVSAVGNKTLQVQAKMTDFNAVCEVRK
jgi:hypothetical protein